MNSPHPPTPRCALAPYFFSAVIFVSILTLSSIALLSLEIFTPLSVLLAAALSLSLTTIFFARCGGPKRLSGAEFVVIALTFLAVALRWNTSVYIYGGQDPGVYTNIASHFAKHGSWIIKDPLLDTFEGRKDLRDSYLSSSVGRTAQNSRGQWHGLMLPGVFLKNLDTNEWVSQFYHANTVWLAIGEWLFGQEWKGLTLSLLSSLTIIAAYLLTVQVSGSPLAGVAAAFLLATNAAHSYIGTFPVSEAVAGFFFLSALSMLTAGYQLTAVLPFAALFLTRITGFLTAPLILISLGWMVVKRRDTRAIWTGLGIIAAYGMSVVWGLHFSGPYSRGIYRGKLGLSSAMIEHLSAALCVVALAWMVTCWLALRLHARLKPLCMRLIRDRNVVTVAALTLVFIGVAFRGYLLAYTDHYAQHRWFGTRWHMAAQGTKSLHYLSLYTLTLMLSPIGFGAFVIGIGQVGRLAFTRARVAPLAICSLGFFAALTIKQLTTPYLYYFGRYLVSELLPLAVICAAIAVHSLSRYAPRLRHGIFTAFCLCVFALLYPSLRTRLKIQEGRQFYEALSCVDQVTPGRSVILVDKRDLPVVPIVTALRFSFQKPIFAFKELPVNQQRRVRELKEYFTSKGYSVYLLSAHDTWGSGDGFGRILRIPAIMRRVGGRAEAPTKITTLSHPIRLYSLQTPNTLPEICQKVREYSR